MNKNSTPECVVLGGPDIIGGGIVTITVLLADGSPNSVQRYTPSFQSWDCAGFTRCISNRSRVLVSHKRLPTKLIKLRTDGVREHVTRLFLIV